MKYIFSLIICILYVNNSLALAQEPGNENEPRIDITNSVNQTDLVAQGIADASNDYSGAYAHSGYGWIAEFIPGLESVPISVFGANA